MNEGEPIEARWVPNAAVPEIQEVYIGCEMVLAMPLRRRPSRAGVAIDYDELIREHVALPEDQGQAR